MKFDPVFTEHPLYRIYYLYEVLYHYVVYVSTDENAKYIDN